MKKLFFALVTVATVGVMASCSSSSCHTCSGASQSALNTEYCESNCAGCSQSEIDTYMSSAQASCEFYSGTWN